MIGKLKGLVDSVDQDSAIIDVNGVGYLIFCSARTLRSLPETGQAISLLIETHVREDHFHLYGFVEKEEQEWFRILTTVQGVGNKMALSILSALAPGEIITAIVSQDKASFTHISGVGPKLAARLLTELKGKVDNLAALSNIQPVASTQEGSKPAQHDVADAVSALTNLGYNRNQAYHTIVKLKDKHTDLQELIREGLKELAS